MKQHHSETCFSSIQRKSRYSITPLLQLISIVKFTEHHFLRFTFEKFFSENYHEFTTIFHWSTHNCIFYCTGWKEFAIPSFSLIKSVQSNQVKPNLIKRFPRKNTQTFVLKIDNHEPLFTKVPPTLFLFKMKRYFFRKSIKRLWTSVLSKNFKK